MAGHVDGPFAVAVLEKHPALLIDQHRSERLVARVERLLREVDAPLDVSELCHRQRLRSHSGSPALRIGAGTYTSQRTSSTRTRTPIATEIKRGRTVSASAARMYPTVGGSGSGLAATARSRSR